jgi:hypothetical protein
MLNLTPFLKAYSSYRVSHLQKQNPTEVQAKQLIDLVRKSTSTQFGKQHNFKNISNVDDFQKNVPLRKYEDFWNEFWKEKYPLLMDCTWPGKVPFFALSSGTSSGTTKYIPVTREMIKSNTKAGLDMLCFHLANNPDSKIFGGLNFMLGGSTQLQNPLPDVFAGDLSGIAVKTLPLWAQARYFPPKELALLSDWEEKIEKLAQAAIKKDIRMLSGVPSWMLIFFKRIIEISGGKSLNEIFPNLEMVVHGGVNFAPYYDQYIELMRGSKAELREVYPASEGFIAIADRGYNEGLRLNLDNGIFYEFIPISELNSSNPTRHWIGNVEVGVNYAIVLSTVSGMWSYVIGDTVKFVDIKTPRILITGRTSYSLSAFGEHLIAEEIEKAVSAAAKEISKFVVDYSVGAIYPKTKDELGGHLFVIEFEGGLVSEEIKNTFISIIDKKLSDLNEDYAGHRAGGFGLNAPKIISVPTGTFAAWMKSRGKLGGQNKVPRLIPDQNLFLNLVNFLQDLSTLR